MDKIKGLNKTKSLWIYLAIILIIGALCFNNIPGTISLLSTFIIGRSLMNSRFGIYWALALAASFFPHYHLKISDLSSWIFLLIFFSIYFLFRYYRDYELKNKKYYYIALAGLFTGISIQFIGLHAIILILLSWIFFNLIYNNIFKLDIKGIFLFLATSILFVFSLSYYEHLTDNINTIESIIFQLKLFELKLRSLKEPFILYLAYILIGYYPSSIFIYKAFRQQATDSPEMKMFKSWMVILLLNASLIFLISDMEKLYFNSIACFPITFLAAYVLDHLHKKSMDFSKVLKSIYIFSGLLASGILFSLPILTNYDKNSNILLPTNLYNNISAVYTDLDYYGSAMGLLLLIIMSLAFRWLKRGHVSYAVISLCTLCIALCFFLLKKH
jgi:hypothetical protein